MYQYEKFADNIGIKVNTEEETLKLACCDCGLVHYEGISILDDKTVMIGFMRDKRATARLRRRKYGYLQQGRKKDKYTLTRTHRLNS